MKKLNKILILLFVVSPQLVFGHEGHVHTGTPIENALHFMLTNIYYIAPLFVAGYFLLKSLRAKQKAKN